MSLQFFETNDTDLAAPWSFPATDAGSVSASKTYHLWADIGTPGNTYRNVRFIIESEISSGVWASAGDPLVDRGELQWRVESSSNPSNDPLFPARSVSGWQPLNSGSVAS